MQRQRFLFAAIAAALLFSTHPVLAANECGAAAAGATVTCNNDGSPASDTGPYANGITYTVPVNLIVDGTVNPIVSNGRIGMISTASGTQTTTTLGDVDIIRINPAAGSSGFGVGDYSNGTVARNMIINLSDGTDITIDQGVAGRSVAAVAAYTASSDITVNSNANINLIHNNNGAATPGIYLRGYTLVGTGSGTLNATIGGDIDIYANGGNSIAGILADAGTSPGSASLTTLNSTANISIDVDGALSSVVQGISAQNGGTGGLYVRSAGTIDITMGAGSVLYGLSALAVNSTATVDILGDITISGDPIARGVYVSGGAIVNADANISAYSATTNAYGIQTLGTSHQINIGDGMEIIATNDGIYSAYGIRTAGTIGGTMDIGENAVIKGVSSTSSSFGIFSSAGAYDIRVRSGALVQGLSTSPATNTNKAGSGMSLNGTTGGTLTLDAGATVEGISEPGVPAYSIRLSDTGNDLVNSYATLIGDAYANGGNDTINLLGGSLTGSVNMGTGDDALNISDLDTAGLSGITHLDGDVGEDALTFTNIDYMGSTMASDDLSLGINLMNGWETINFVNSDWTLTGDLVLGGSTVNIDATSTLYAGGGVNPVISSVIPGDPATVNNAGVIDLTNGASGSGDVLTIMGDYVGNGGTILMHVYANGVITDSDMLVVDGGNGGGSISGTTTITIVDTDQLGAQTTGNGILLVQTINGATTTDNAFTLSNPRISVGAYDYVLEVNDANDNWYLVSAAAARNEILADMALPDLSHRLGLAMLGRVEDRQPDGDRKVWARSFGQTGRVGQTGNVTEHGPGYDYTVAGGQIGMDLYRTPSIERTRDIVGIYTAAGHMSADIDAPGGANAGDARMTAYAMGAYWTHHAPQGWYVDTAAQATYYDNVRTQSDSGENFSTHGYGYLASVEGGKDYPVAKNLVVTPQAQITGQTVKLDDSADSFGGVDYRNANAVYTRAGVKVTKTFDKEDGPVKVWVMPGIVQSFGADAKTVVTDTSGGNAATFRNDLGGSALLLSTGVSANFSDAVALFAAADYSTSLSRPGNAIAGRVGIKLSW